MKLAPLPSSFYDRPTLKVTRDLLGSYLVRQNGRKKWIGKIVEVEAYIGEDDPACHAFRGRTPRTSIMYGPPGHAYVYFTYGMYFMLNAVTERKGFPAAILIRAVEPTRGFENPDSRPASGPGKLCRCLGIDKKLNGISLQSKQLWIGKDTSLSSKREQVQWSSRIGISAGTEKLWRAFLTHSTFVSGKRKTTT